MNKKTYRQISAAVTEAQNKLNYINLLLANAQAQDFDTTKDEENKPMPIIVIDPGHGGRDPGAINREHQLEEAHLVLAISRELKRELQDYFVVLMTRNTHSKYLSLTARAAYANQHKANLFISIHCNSATNADASGFEIFTSPGDTEADMIASDIYSEWNLSKKRHDYSDGDPDKEAKFTVLTKTKMPAVLIELGFISNYAEALNMHNNPKTFAKEIANGIFRAFPSNEN